MQSIIPNIGEMNKVADWNLKKKMTIWALEQEHHMFFIHFLTTIFIEQFLQE